MTDVMFTNSITHLSGIFMNFLCVCTRNILPKFIIAVLLQQISSHPISLQLISMSATVTESEFKGSSCFTHFRKHSARSWLASINPFLKGIFSYIMFICDIISPSWNRSIVMSPLDRMQRRNIIFMTRLFSVT